METNFFQTLAQLNIAGDWVIVIKQESPEHFIVTALLKNDKVDDKARKIIPPLNFEASPEQLDEGFFDRIAQPFKATADILTNMEMYARQQEEAQKQSKMQKEKEAKEKKEKEEKQKKYEGLMKKVTELEAEKKFREAVGKLPDPAEFPDQAEDIGKKKQELVAKFGQPALFDE